MPSSAAETNEGMNAPSLHPPAPQLRKCTRLAGSSELEVYSEEESGRGGSEARSGLWAILWPLGPLTASHEIYWFSTFV